jgi:hypothetical protein
MVGFTEVVIALFRGSIWSIEYAYTRKDGANIKKLEEAQAAGSNGTAATV